MMILIAAVSGYLVGSVLFGPMAVRLAGLPDLRGIGSGNIGATNVLRTGRKDLAILTLIGDAGKGAFAAGIMGWLSGQPSLALVAGFAGVVGHNYPLWHRFVGGKGVATSLSVHFIWWPAAGAIALLVWLVVALLGRMSSLASLCALAAVPIAGLIMAKTTSWRPPTDMTLWIIASLGILVLALWRHRVNIKRIIAKEESRISLKKSTK